MHPELFSIPGLFTIKTYGFFLMVGFLSAVWLAMKRAARVGVDPDRILDVSFIALVFGLLGARLFYVAHYWSTQFADKDNAVFAILDIRQGGLEFLGGLLGATVAAVPYLIWKKQSIRLILDIMAPGVMWGVAFGRVGCFFNGCCFGGVCALGASHPARGLAVQFPYGSPAHIRHWEDRKQTIPAELIPTSRNDLSPWPVSAELLFSDPEPREAPRRVYDDAVEQLRRAKQRGAGAESVQQLTIDVENTKRKLAEHESSIEPLRRAMSYPSRLAPDRRITVSELQDLARESPTTPVYATQLFAAAHGLILSALLSAVFRVRKRHGSVIGLLFVLYPVARMLEEMIRVDNPRDVFGMTVSQSISLGMFLAGAVYLAVLYLKMPERSKYADRAAPSLAE